MTRLVDLAETKNAAEFKDIFEEKIAAKIIDVLEAKKTQVAKNSHKPMFKNPAEIHGSAEMPLHVDSRGDISMWTGQVDHSGGLSNPKHSAVKEGARTDVEGLNPDELNKGPQHGGGFTNEVPLKKVWYKPEIKTGATIQPSKK